MYTIQQNMTSNRKVFTLLHQVRMAFQEVHKFCSAIIDNNQTTFETAIFTFTICVTLFNFKK